MTLFQRDKFNFLKNMLRLKEIDKKKYFAQNLISYLKR